MINSQETIKKLFEQKSFPSNQENCLQNVIGNRKIILYGGGDGFVTFLFFVLKKYGLKAEAVIDRKFVNGGVYFGVPTFSAEGYLPTNEEKADAVAVVTVGKLNYHEEIFNFLRGLGFKNIIAANDIYEYYTYNTPPELEKRGFDYYLDNKDMIIGCLDFFSDDLSREVYTLFMQTHMQRKPIRIPSCKPEEQYFPPDIKLSKGCSRFINCGSYNGDTVRRLHMLYGQIDALACFEPDPGNFQLLAKYLSDHHRQIAKSAVAFPCGVFSHEMQFRFAAGNLINSAITENGDSIIQCVALDHALPGFKPTFINMDIEGAELAALKGAETLIKENKPDLAISAYHAPNDMWEIPRYLHNLNLGYKFYLRNYSSFISDTVLYATI